MKERGVYERIQLLYTVFSNEEKKIHKKIAISNLVYNSFLSYQFEGNIGELKNTIKVCCARSLHRQKGDVVEIHMEDLPDKMFQRDRYEQRIHNESDDRMIMVQDLNHEGVVISPLLELYDHLLSIEDSHIKFVNECLNYLQEYYHKLTFDNRNVETYKNDFIFENLDSILKKTLHKYGCKINNNDILSLFRYIEDGCRQPFHIRQYCDKRKTDMLRFQQQVASALPKEERIADELMTKINRQLDMKFDPLCKALLTLNIRSFNRNIELKKRIGIIMAHGYSTASSIADAANKLLGDYIFESIDMDIDTDTQRVVDELNDYLKSNNNFEELVLLVDMGSLEQIYTGIDHEINANIGIINNITTKLALEVGNELRNNSPLQKLLQNVCEGNAFHYRLIEKKTKEDVIVCACASGLGTAEKLRSLLLSSIPESLGIHIITYDYNVLISQKKSCELFEKYNVICIIGTLDPVIDTITFIPIQELIVEQDIEKMNHILKDYMNYDEIEKFKQDILKNFSLSNVMNYLTILNPNMLLEHVALALDNFQKLYGIQICNKTCVGLYVHICCMIERLVVRQPLENYVDIERLHSMEQRFITCIRKAFEETQRYYGIEIPEHEIGYIFDYIQNDQESNQNEW